MPLEFASPCGNFDDFELSSSRADSHALAARTTMRAPDVILAAGGLVDVADAVASPLVVGRHLARHRVGDERQPPGRQRRRQQHRRRREVRVRRAAAAALPAVVARRRDR